MFNNQPRASETFDDTEPKCCAECGAMPTDDGEATHYLSCSVWIALLPNHHNHQHTAPKEGMS